MIGALGGKRGWFGDVRGFDSWACFGLEVISSHQAGLFLLSGEEGQDFKRVLSEWWNKKRGNSSRLESSLPQTTATTPAASTAATATPTTPTCLEPISFLNSNPDVLTSKILLQICQNPQVFTKPSPPLWSRPVAKTRSRPPHAFLVWTEDRPSEAEAVRHPPSRAPGRARP